MRGAFIVAFGSEKMIDSNQKKYTPQLAICQSLCNVKPKAHGLERCAPYCGFGH